MIVFRNGGHEMSPLLGKFCGTDIPTEIISQTNQMYLKFVSDASRGFSGFSIEWDSTTTGKANSIVTLGITIRFDSIPSSTDVSRRSRLRWKSECRQRRYHVTELPSAVPPECRLLLENSSCGGQFDTIANSRPATRAPREV